MSDAYVAAPVPAYLAEAGEGLWVSVASKYALRPDELRILEDACAEVDLIEDLRAAFVGEPRLVRGSQGQDVIHPFVAELRQHRSTLKALLNQLRLPDLDESGVPQQTSAGDRSAAARTVANARWSRRGA